MTSASSKDYEADIILKTSYGNYNWCGSRGLSGNYLYNSTDDKKNSNQSMLYINITMNDSLYENTQYIEIFNLKNQRLYCSHEITSKNYIFLFENYKLEKEIIIKFMIADHTNYDFKSLRRIPMITHFEKKVIVPNIEVKGDSSCPICLESTENDKYITPCGHCFHTKCIFKYLETIDLLDYKCTDEICTHGPTIKEFKCPSCKQIVDF